MIYEWSHYGLDVNTVLQKYQETEEVRPDVKNKMKEFYELLDKDKYKEAENILIGLEEETAPEHPLTVGNANCVGVGDNSVGGLRMIYIEKEREPDSLTQYRQKMERRLKMK